ncbi:hypothetical protein [Nonomuraea jiangxiensis]|uniref:hypothetical protein n=1 Tax=Nonomuraea jiangxiensis TaxID=633440 RepID=UPI00115F9C6B|nr:hypothetical protein [Nonomuraea jiangxiensis]
MLIRAIESTPYARAEHQAAKLGDTTASDLERARHWWIQCTRSCSGEADASWSRPTSRTRVNNPAGSKRAAAALHASRSREAVIEQVDAFELIERMVSPQTAMYVDPPYLCSTRNAFGSGHYVKGVGPRARPAAATPRRVQVRRGAVRLPVESV